MTEDDSLLEGFIEESKEHLEKIQEDILTLEKQADHPDLELVDRIFRAMHTIKGNAGFFELFAIRDLSHALEDFLSCVRNKEVHLTRSNADTVLEGVDILQKMVYNTHDSSIQNNDALIGRIRGLIAKDLGSAKQDVYSSTVEIDSEINDLGFDISGFELKKVKENQAIFLISMRLDIWEKTTKQSPVQFIKLLLNKGYILKDHTKEESPKEFSQCNLFANFTYATSLNKEELTEYLGLEDSNINEIQYKVPLDTATTPNSHPFKALAEEGKSITQKDLSPLIKVMEKLEEALLDKEIPKAALEVAKRLHALATNVLMGESAFDVGIKKIQTGLEKLVSIEESEIAKEAAVTPEAKAPSPPSSEGQDTIMKEFVALTLTSIDSWAAIVLEIEKDAPDALGVFKGVLHTLKGELGFLNQNHYVEIVHEIEERLDHKKISTQELLSFLDSFTQTLRDWQGGNLSLTNDLKSQIFSEELSAPKEQLIINDPVQKSQKEIIKQESPKTTPKEEKNLTNINSSKPLRSEETLRVGVDRLDKLIDAIGEAVIAHGIATGDKVVANTKDEINSSDRAQLKQKLDRLDIIMRQIQEYSMSLRMVNLKATFQKMARLVRDLSRQLNKPVDFKMEGEETELDKSIVEHLADPLIHLIRNSMDHGLEEPSERLASQKQETGTITIRSYHKSGNVVIEVEDDGRGLNTQKILEKAIANGVIDENNHLDESEIYHLIFAPGFSTAENVTQISGRGVGMDVVKRNIESLRGSVDIQSVLGVKTKLTLKLPLTLAIINGMVVACKNEKYIIPTLSVLETLRVKRTDIQRVAHRGQLIQIREDLVKVFNLSEILDVTENEEWEEKIGLIIEDSMGRKCALLTDSILDQQQVVIKKLSEEMGSLQSLAGGAIMNDGTVSLILDVSGLLRMAFK